MLFIENAATPYQATVVINNTQYGVGYGTSKKSAKLEAARVTLETLIPEMKNENSDSSSKKGEVDLSVSNIKSYLLSIWLPIHVSR